MFDANSVLAATVPTPEESQPQVIREDRVWGLFTDDLDVESVRAYELVTRGVAVGGGLLVHHFVTTGLGPTMPQLLGVAAGLIGSTIIFLQSSSNTPAEVEELEAERGAIVSSGGVDASPGHHRIKPRGILPKRNTRGSEAVLDQAEGARGPTGRAHLAQ